LLLALWMSERQMDSLETFVVDSVIASEKEFYRKIIGDNITSLKLAPAIGKIKVILRPEDSLFQMVIIVRDIGNKVKIIDCRRGIQIIF